jgi:hypothetical protein
MMTAIVVVAIIVSGLVLIVVSSLVFAYVLQPSRPPLLSRPTRSERVAKLMSAPGVHDLDVVSKIVDAEIADEQELEVRR